VSEPFLPPRTDEPEWVKAWRKAREAEDWRSFPEQIPALAELVESGEAVEIPTAAFTDNETWVQIGEYGYQGCAYDFNAPVENNRICVMHPHAPGSQPLRRVLVGGMAFMLCLDCEARYQERRARSE
jgi:hypothetical protein